MKYREYIRSAQAQYWRELKEQTGGNVTEMSRISKVNRSDIYKHMDRCGIEPNRRNRGNEAWRELGR